MIDPAATAGFKLLEIDARHGLAAQNQDNSTMEQIRRVSRKRWITGLVLGVFVLWSGMVLCMLPDGAPQLSSHHAGVRHSDCFDGGAQTFCKSDGHTSIHSWMPKFSAIDSRLSDRIYLPVIFDLPVFDIVAPPAIKPPRLFLVLCTFLK